MKAARLTFTAALLTLAVVAKSQGDVIVTYAESPGALNSSLSNTDVFNFDSLPTNQALTNVSWSGVGTFDQLYVKPGDQYGGANGSNYSLQGAGTSVTTTTLTLNTASAYFGFWWSAGDKYNKLDFYSGSTLKAEFTTGNLLAALPSSYNGMPSGPFAGQNSSQPYAFINFFANSGTTWDKVVFTNGSGTTGFEGDNYTSRVAPYNSTTDGPMPGVPVETISGTNEIVAAPEPTTWAGLCIALGGIAYMKRSRRKA